MNSGAFDPEYIVDGLTELDQVALVELKWRPELARPIKGWRDALMTFRQHAPPALTVQGRAVQSAILRRINAAQADTHAERRDVKQARPARVGSAVAKPCARTLSVKKGR